jgi:V/A-type H+-transporting ATPase subunit I
MSSGKIKALKSMSSLGMLIAICGLSATVFGFLYGSVFGFEEEFLGIEIHPLWISPIHNILQILMVAVGTGVVLLIIAFLLSIVNGFLSRNWGHLIFGHTGIAGFLLYLSFLGIVGTTLLKLPIPSIVFIVLAVLSGVAVMLSEVLIGLVDGHGLHIEGGLATYLIQAPVELFEAVISLLSNSLSFVRVGAFAVAHGGLSSAIFILAELASPSHGLGYWLVVFIGNIFIVGFEGLIVGIQTMRLHYYEFLGKFFTGGGQRFEPLTLHPADREESPA